MSRPALRLLGHRQQVVVALAAGGNDAEALAVYERLRAPLRDDLGAAPSTKTMALHRALLA